MSSRKPHTVGGSTIGMVKMVSKIPLKRSDALTVAQAASSPSTKITAMATSVVRSDTHSGDQSSVEKNSPRASKPSTLPAMLIVAASCSTPDSA